MRSVLGMTFKRPHARATVRVIGVKREKGRAYVVFAPDFPNSHLCYGRLDINRFNRLIGREVKPKKRK